MQNQSVVQIFGSPRAGNPKQNRRTNPSVNLIITTNPLRLSVSFGFSSSQAFVEIILVWWHLGFHLGSHLFFMELTIAVVAKIKYIWLDHF